MANYEVVLDFPIRGIAPAVWSGAGNLSGMHTPAQLNRGATRRAFGAEPSEDEFAFAKDPVTERA